jgi:phosphatidylglycerophosphatase A
VDAAQRPLPPLGRTRMLIANLFGLGLLPGAPGTYGSFAALPFAWLIARGWGWSGLLAAAIVVALVGWWAAAASVRALGEDPQSVVIDEVAGQFLTLAAAPLDPYFYAAGFALFRCFDILKPWPVGWADRRIPGGLGVMADDLLAAVYAGLLVLIARLVLGR